MEVLDAHEREDGDLQGSHLLFCTSCHALFPRHGHSASSSAHRLESVRVRWGEEAKQSHVLLSTWPWPWSQRLGTFSRSLESLGRGHFLFYGLFIHWLGWMFLLWPNYCIQARRTSRTQMPQSFTLIWKSTNQGTAQASYMGLAQVDKSAIEEGRRSGGSHSPAICTLGIIFHFSPLTM
jgi:hypothetical protein